MISNKEYKNKDLAQDKEYMDVRRRLPTYTPLNMSTELKVKDVVLGTYTLTDLFSKDSSAAMNCEARDNETRTRPLMRSVARAASFTIPRSVDSMPSENVNGPEDQPLRFVPCAYRSSTGKPSVSLKIIASPELGRGYNNHLRKTIASPRKGRASNDLRTSAQRRGRMSPCAPLIAGAPLHHGIPGLRKENDGEMCSNNQIRRTTRTSGSGGRRARHVINVSTPAGPPDAGGGTTCPLCAHADQPRLARQEGCFAASLHRLWVWSADQSRHCKWHSGRPPAHYGGQYRAADQAGPDDSGHIISPAPAWDAESDVGA